MNDFDICYNCGGIIEAGGDSSCICDTYEDDKADFEYHRRKDEEAERRTE